jgi:predicted DNA binding protein
VAYYEGYFDWPRHKTGEEIATDMGVAGPTFHQHIRKGIHRILRDVFDGWADET